MSRAPGLDLLTLDDELERLSIEAVLADPQAAWREDPDLFVATAMLLLLDPEARDALELDTASEDITRPVALADLTDRVHEGGVASLSPEELVDVLAHPEQLQAVIDALDVLEREADARPLPAPVASTRSARAARRAAADPLQATNPAHAPPPLAATTARGPWLALAAVVVLTLGAVVLYLWLERHDAPSLTASESPHTTEAAPPDDAPAAADPRIDRSEEAPDDTATACRDEAEALAGQARELVIADPDDAAQRLEQALACEARAEWRALLAFAHERMGNLCVARGHYLRAIDSGLSGPALERARRSVGKLATGCP